MVPLPVFLSSTIAVAFALGCQALLADDSAPNEQISPINLALELAAKIEEPLHRRRALLEMAEAQILAGDQQDALVTLDRAVSDLSSMSEYSSSEKDLLVKAATQIAEAGDVERAFEVVGSMRPGRFRIALGKIAHGLVVDGDVDGALKIANVDIVHRRYLLTRIIVSLSHEGNVSRALSLVRQLKDRESWDRRRSSIVLATVRIATQTKDLKLIDTAMQVLPEFESTYMGLEAKAELGKAAARLGNAELGRTLLSEVLDASHTVKNQVWRNLLHIQRAEGLLILNEHQAALSAIDQALAAAGELSHEASRKTVAVRTLRQASDLFAQNGYQKEGLDFLQEAIRQAHQIANPEDRLRAYLEIVSLCVSQGAEERLARLFAQAMQSTKHSSQAYLLDSIRREYAIALAQAGKHDEALELLPAIQTASIRSWCLGRLVYFLVLDGREDAAIDAILSTETTELRHQTLANLASQLGKQSRLDAALKVIDLIDEPPAKDLGRRLCALSLANAGVAKDGVRVALLIENDSTRQFVMNQIAEIAVASGDIETATMLAKEHSRLIEKRGLAECARLLASAGYVEQAINSAQQCSDSKYRAQVLFNIALILATEPISTTKQASEAIGPRRMKDTFSPTQIGFAEELLNLASKSR